MKQIRYNTFETNSSSTHSITISTEEEYNDFRAGKLYKGEDDKLYTLEGAGECLYSSVLKREFKEAYASNDLATCREILEDNYYQTYDQLEDDECDCGLETYCKHFTTPSGDHMVAWGHYGYNG